MTEGVSRKGYGFGVKHIYLVLDGSGSMADEEIAQIEPRKSGEAKHVRVARMVQNLINYLNDNPNTFLSVIHFDANEEGVLRITEPLESYNTLDNTYKDQEPDIWDPLPEHGNATPLGGALSHVRAKAETWVSEAVGQELRRAVIFLMSDGMNNVEPDGSGEKEKIQQFNSQHGDKGYIRLATIGYYQFAETRLNVEGISTANLSQDDKAAYQEEAQGRALLKSLVEDTDKYYFEANDIEAIQAFIEFTVQTAA